jgi:hypothetical protein
VEQQNVKQKMPKRQNVKQKMSKFKL